MSVYNKHIVLLKDSVPDSPLTDPYHQLFTQADYQVRYSTPISFEITSQHTTALIDELRNIDQGKYSGVIITSPRVFTLLYTIHTTQHKLFTSNVSNIPLYHIYSQSSIDWCNKLHFSNARSAEQVTDSSTLAQYILNDTFNRTGLPLLFICGQQRLNALPSILQQNNILHNECIVYDTVVKPNFASELDTSIDVLQHTHVDKRIPLLQSKHTMSNSIVIFVVYFSPSGVDAYYGDASGTRITTFDSRIHQNKLLLNTRHKNIKIICIGNTTANTLIQYGIQPDAIASTPTPEALLRACEQFIPTVSDVLDAVQQARQRQV